MGSLFSFHSSRTLRREAQAWVLRLASGEATLRDGEAFRRWCRQSPAHAHAALQARTVWQGLEPAARAVAQQAQASKRAAEAGLLRPGRRAWLGGAVAAGAAWLVARPPLDWWPGLDDWRADYHTGTGEQRSIALQDGVQVALNTQTRVDLLSRGAGIELLAGEAEITAPTAIRVMAAGGRITAQSARFNVRYINAQVCVTCLQGDVRIESSRGRAVRLQARQQATYDSNGVGTPGAPVDVDTSDVLAWRQRMLVFNNAPLEAVVRELNRYRPGRIIIADAELGGRKVLARFSLDRLDDALALIQGVTHASITKLPGGVVVLGNVKFS